MKKILLLLILLLSLTSCSLVEDFIKNNTNSIPSQNQGSGEDENKTDHTHTYDRSVTAPTCESKGYTTYTCQKCGDKHVSDEVDALGHNEITLASKDATCTSSGLSEGKMCTVCAKIIKAQETINALGHIYNHITTPPTCESDGYTTYICTSCNDTFTSNEISATGHSEIIVTGVNATCTQDGLSDGKICSICNTVTVAQNTLPALGHSYSSETVAPTCETEGYTSYTCSACGDDYIADNVPALGHNEIVIPGKDATETSTGLTEGKGCSTCGKITVPQIVTPALGHSYTITTVAPTCEEEGYISYVCTDCNDSFVTNIIPALGHAEEIIPGKAATCTNPGLTDGKKCTVCNTVTVTQTTITALGHNEVTVSGKAATCTEPGLTDGKRCTVCNTVTVKQTTISALGHKEITISGKAATCTDSGLTDGKKCSVCNTITVNQTTISALGHKEITISGKAATCTDSGLTDGKKCSVCNTITVTQITITAFGHNWTPATTEAPKTCLICGTTEGEKLPESSSPTYSETLYVNYINVGQGDSILIKVGDCDILIDAGVANQGSTVSKYLKNQGVDDIELMINTHPDADHCGGLTTVLNDFVVEEVWASPLTKTTAAYKNFASAVSKEGLTMETPSVGTIYTYEYMTLTVLYNGAGTSDSNDSSIVVMLQYGSFRFLFTGDISSTIESKLVSNSNIDLSCDVLKVAHHGSKYSSNMEFLRATGAKYGVICVGDNSYGHPTSSALNNLKNAGISVYRTDQNGNVVFSSNGATLTTPGGTTLAEGSASYNSSSSTSSSSITYIGNSESKVFHLPTCSNLPAVSKRNYLYNYWFIVNCIGYRPCQICMKNYTP